MKQISWDIRIGSGLQEKFYYSFGVRAAQLAFWWYSQQVSGKGGGGAHNGFQSTGNKFLRLPRVGL